MAYSLGILFFFSPRRAFGERTKRRVHPRFRSSLADPHPETARRCLSRPSSARPIPVTARIPFVHAHSLSLSLSRVCFRVRHTTQHTVATVMYNEHEEARGALREKIRYPVPGTDMYEQGRGGGDLFRYHSRGGQQPQSPSPQRLKYSPSRSPSPPKTRNRERRPRFLRIL